MFSNRNKISFVLDENLFLFFLIKCFPSYLLFLLNIPFSLFCFILSFSYERICFIFTLFCKRFCFTFFFKKTYYFSYIMICFHFSKYFYFRGLPNLALPFSCLHLSSVTSWFSISSWLCCSTVSIAKNSSPEKR